MSNYNSLQEDKFDTMGFCEYNDSKSKGLMNHFRYLLFSGNIEDITNLYYDDEVVMIFNNKEKKTKEKSLGLGLLKEALEYLRILQFDVFDLKQAGNNMSYGIYMVTQNKDNTIDFSEHRIVNFWKNNRIEQHHHTIINN